MEVKKEIKELMWIIALNDQSVQLRNVSVFVHERMHECMSNDTDVTEDLYIKEKKRTSYKYLQLVEINAMIIALYYIII